MDLLIRHRDAVVFALMFPLHQILFSLGATVALIVRGGTKTGGYTWAWNCSLTKRLRQGFFWRWASSYFPCKLHTTARLPPDGGPYIFVSHPHGIIGIAPSTHFGTYASGFDEAFPGIPVHLLGHRAIFRIPFFREWVLLHGHSTVERSNCLNLLRKGHSIAIAPGGAKESLESIPGTMRLYLTHRKGFAKLALMTGAALVPVISFGENETYNLMHFSKGTIARRIQDGLQSRLGFAMPLFYGRWFLPMMPRRQAVHTIVGEPLRLDTTAPSNRGNGNDDISVEELDLLHQKYCDALANLFEKQKSAYGATDMKLQLI